MKRISLFPVYLLAISLLVNGPALAQQATTSLRGTVVDPSGSSIAGAKVTLSNPGTGFTREATTPTDGAYEFLQLPPATYSLAITAKGFRTYQQEGISLLVAIPSTVNVKMQVGAATETVEVTAANAPAVNTIDATVGDAFEEKQVESLPFLARNVVNLLTLQPGVVFTGQSDTDLLSVGTMQSLDLREGSVDGVRGNQTNVTVDGVDSNDWQNQSPFTSALPITLDSVEEFRVTTTNANATDGLVGGPQVTLVTKSGTNSFHGNVRWYYRTSGFTANQWFNNHDGIPRAKLQRNIPGGSLGGPIWKDRIFFFVDTEERREASSEPAGPRQVPTDALRDGILVYSCSDPTDPRCQGMTAMGLTGPHAIPAGAFGLNPAQFKSLDPNPTNPGVNPAMISVLNLYPRGNDPALGNDGGLSFNAFAFNSPISRTGAIQTVKLDFKLTPDGRHSLSWKGALADDHFDLRDAQFPGQPAASTLLNNSKGFVLQYQGQLGPNLVNTARYGLTRLGVEETGISGASFHIRSFDNLFASNAGGGPSRDTSHRVPVHEINDNIAYTHGTHSLQFGGVLRLVHNKRIDFANSFPDYLINDGFCQLLCADILNQINGTNFPNVGDTDFFDRAAMALTGSITQVSATFLTNPKAGTILPVGSPELREFAENDFEIYGQDSWRVRPNLTLTFGVRYGRESPPWEVNGLEVTPTTDILQWFHQREFNMNNGIPSSASPLLSWGLAGKTNNRNSWYRPNNRDFAPRVAMAYSPGFSSGIGHFLFGEGGKTAIRLGSGLFYDRIGQALAVDSDLNGSPGTATSLIDGSQQFGFSTAPRFSGTCSANGACTGLPPLATFLAGIPTTATFPFTPLPNASGLGFAIDPHLRTPYTIHLTASIQRQLPKSVVVDAAYVGTLGRRLLGKIDYAQYLDLRDPASKTDLWSAYQKITAIANISPSSTGPALDPTNLQQLATIQSIPFFNNIVPNMPAFAASFLGNPAYAGVTPTQAFYAYVTQDTFASWSCALFPMDTQVGPNANPSPWSSAVDPTGTGFALFQQQFSTLPGWTNFANSNYHSLQLSVRKSAGLVTMGFNYVFSKSIDNTSSAENGDLNQLGNGTLNGLIQNPFNLRAGRALSDFDLRHNFNGNWVVDLPFGKGHSIGGGAGRLKELLIGGWQISGLARWHSGFPQTPGNGFNFPTNFFLTTPGTLTASVSTHVVHNVTGQSSPSLNGQPNLFSNPSAALAAITFTGPGLSGTRSFWRGPAYAGVDAGIAKSLHITERQRMQFRMTAFNVFNSVNFADTESLDPTAPNVFGQFIATAGPRGGPREVEFAVRYEF